MARSFAAEDFHLLPIHQLAGRSGMRAGLLLKGILAPKTAASMGQNGSAEP